MHVVTSQIVVWYIVQVNFELINASTILFYLIKVLTEDSSYNI